MRELIARQNSTFCLYVAKIWRENIERSSTIRLKACLGAFVCMDKADFIGRQALSKLRDKGRSSRMMVLILDAGGNLYGGESVYLNDRVVGRVRSANFGHTIEKDIGLVYLPLDLAKAGTELEVEVMGECITARVAELPLVNPAGAKLMA